MASPIGEAFIRIRPDFTTFAAEAEAGIARVRGLLGAIEIPIVPVVAAGPLNLGPLIAQTEALGTSSVLAAEESAGLNAATIALNANMQQSAKIVLAATVAQTRYGTILGATIAKVDAAVASNTALAASLEAVAASGAARAVAVTEAAPTQAAGAAATELAAAQTAVGTTAAEASVAETALSAALTEVGAALTATAAGMTILATEQAALATSTAALSAGVEAAAAVAGSAGAATGAENALAGAQVAAGVSAETAAPKEAALAAANDAVATSAAAAGAASGSAAAGVTALGGASGRGVTHMHNAAGAAGALRGAVIGLSRITPVAVFGLGLAGTAAIAAGLAFRKAVSDAAQFQEQLNVFQAVSQATAQQMEAVRQEAVDLGRDISLPATSANDAADAMTELAKAGLTVNNTLAATRGVLQLAAAAQTSAADAARITAFALNAFALSGDKATHVADLLAAASIAAQGEITDMANALAQSASVAAQANISIEDTTTAISLLAKNGLLGSDAGTSLRTTILRLVPTTKEAAQFTKALGISFQDAAGNLRPLPQIFQQYQQALKGLPETLRQAALQQIFGQDAIRAAAILTREGAAGFRTMREEVDRSGAAAELAAARSKGLAGATNALASNAETLGTKIGTALIPQLTELVQNLNDVVTAADKAFDALSKLAGFDIPGTQNKVGSRIDRFLRDFVLSPFGFETKSARFLIDAFTDSTEKSSVAARKFADDIRGGVAPAFQLALTDITNFVSQQKALQTGLKFGPIINKEDINAQTKAAVAAADRNFNELVTHLQATLRVIGRLGVKNEVAKPFEETVNTIVETLKQLGPRGEQAIRDLPPKLAAIFRQIKAQLLAEADFTIPIRFDIQGDLATLTPTLVDDLRRATQRENFLQGEWDKLERQGKTLTKRAKQVADQLASAHAARQALIDQIQSDQKAENQKVTDALRQSIANRQQQLENNLLAAQGQGVQAQLRAQQALVRFFREMSRNTRLTESERLKFAGEATQAQNNLQETLRQIAQDRKQTIFSLRELDLQNAALRAQLTPSNADNVKNLKDQIKFYRDQAKLVGIKTEEGKRLLGQMIQAQINLKNLVNQAQGESPDVFVNRLFSEAADQFRRFGSNISNAAGGLLSPQSTRGEFAGLLLGGQVAQRTRDQQLAEEKKQTAYLQIIAGGPRRIVTGTRVPPSVAAEVSRIANAVRGL